MCAKDMTGFKKQGKDWKNKLHKNLSKKKPREAKISLPLTLLRNPWLKYIVKSLYPFVTS